MNRYYESINQSVYSVAGMHSNSLQYN